MLNLLIILNDHLQDHADTIKGTLGFVMAVTFPLIESLNEIIQFVGALGGLFLLYYAIKHKMIQYKIDKKKLKESKNGSNSGV